MMIIGELAVLIIGNTHRLRRVSEWISGAPPGSTNTYRGKSRGLRAGSRRGDCLGEEGIYLSGHMMYFSAIAKKLAR